MAAHEVTIEQQHEVINDRLYRLLDYLTDERGKPLTPAKRGAVAIGYTNGFSDALDWLREQGVIVRTFKEG